MHEIKYMVRLGRSKRHPVWLEAGNELESCRGCEFIGYNYECELFGAKLIPRERCEECKKRIFGYGL